MLVGGEVKFNSTVILFSAVGLALRFYWCGLCTKRKCLLSRAPKSAELPAGGGPLIAIKSVSTVDDELLSN